MSDVDVRLGGQTVLCDVNMAVREGEFVAVLGPNGAGKSTLLKAVLGLVPIAKGRVTVLGSEAHRGNPAIGYLPQRRAFGPEIRIRGRDVVRLGLDGTRWGVPVPVLGSLLGSGSRSRREQRRVDEAIELVGAEGMANRAIGELSGGEQQRLLIAQALVAQPRIVLLDEPLESLDLQNQQAVAGIIRTISEERGVSVLLVAHDVNPIQPYLDRVVYIAAGHVLIGEPEEVITSEKLSKLYGAPIEVLRAQDGRIVVVGQPEEVSYHAHEHR